MAVTVPAQHKCNPLYTQIANLKTMIASNVNPVITIQYKQQLVQLQQQLVGSLVESGALPASAILNTMAFNAADANT